MDLENEIMGAYSVVFDHLDHLGPGDSATTRNLVERLRSDLPSASRVADFGCGVGASALVLAQCLPEPRVLALDSHAPFIARLETAASERLFRATSRRFFQFCKRPLLINTLISRKQTILFS